MRLVLDSNILVRASAKPHGLASELLLAVLAEGHTLVISNEILSEVVRVLLYPRLAAVHKQSEETIYNFVGWLRDAAETVTLNPLTLAPTRDPSDIIVLQTALHGDADILCTGDQDFFAPPASLFLASAGIAVLTDVQLKRRFET